MAWTDVSVCYGHPAVRSDSSADALLHAMDAAEVAKAWVFGYGAIATHDFAAANDRVAELAKSHPDRIVPIGLVNPMYAFPEVDRLLGSGFRGVKILTGWGNWLTIDNVRRVVIPIAERVCKHSGHLSVALEGCFPPRGGSVYLPFLIRESCPDVCLVIDRCWSAAAWEDYLALAHADPSIWVTAHALPQRLLERVVSELGMHRLLLGSWYPETDPDLVYLPFERAAGSRNRVGAILTRNADRVLEGSPPPPGE